MIFERTIEMQNVQLFNFEDQQVRTLTIDDQPYFVGKDVAEILGYSRGRKAVNDHVRETHKHDVPIRDAIGREQRTTVIDEAGLYSLVLSSKLPNAEKFQEWVTSEVLPAIRKHGAYMTDQKIEEVLTDPDTIIQLATQLKEEREARLIAEQQVNELKPKATYYDRILANPALVTITVIAKDYGMSGAAMNKKLHDLGVQYRQGNIWLLYSKYQKLGWTQSETHMIERNDGTEKAVVNTKWTQKGRLGLYELLKQNDVLPLIEKDEVA